MAESYLHSLLGEREKVIFIARQHWFILASSIFIEIVLIIAVIVAVTLAASFFPGIGVWALIAGLLLFLLPMATMLRDILNWTNRQFIITTRRVMQISGVFNKVVADSSLEKVNDVKMVQSALGRLFDFGDIEILTASELGVNLFKRIEQPVRFKTAMINAKNNLETPEDFPMGVAGHKSAEAIPALIAQLDALRQQGVLTEQEFQAKKAELLSKM